MNVSVPKEVASGERRVALVPEVVERLVQSGLQVTVESGAGDGAHHPDAAYEQAGASTGDGKGMWSDSTFRDLVQYNDGFRTGLIGTPEQIARRMVEYRKRGVDLLLLGFLHYLQDIDRYCTDILPIVRELEREAIERGELEEPAA